MDYIISILPAMFTGLQTTMMVFVFTLIGSLPLGIILALLMSSRFKFIKWIIEFYIWIIRGTPLMLQLVFVFYGLAVAGFIFKDRMVAALFTFIINYAAYFAEIFRGGIASIDKGQFEVSKVLGLSSYQTAKNIIIPQVFKRVFPSVANEVITLIKDTALIYVIGIGELLRVSYIASNRDVSLIPYLLAGIIYLLLGAILTFIFKHIENKLNYYR